MSDIQSELNRLKEIEGMMQQVFEDALEARNAADRVLKQRQEIGMRLTKMQIEIQQARLAESTDG